MLMASVKNSHPKVPFKLEGGRLANLLSPARLLPHSEAIVSTSSQEEQQPAVPTSVWTGQLSPGNSSAICPGSGVTKNLRLFA